MAGSFWGLETQCRMRHCLCLREANSKSMIILQGDKCFNKKHTHSTILMEFMFMCVREAQPLGQFLQRGRG